MPHVNELDIFEDSRKYGWSIVSKGERQKLLSKH